MIIEKLVGSSDLDSSFEDLYAVKKNNAGVAQNLSNEQNELESLNEQEKFLQQFAYPSSIFPRNVSVAGDGTPYALTEEEDGR